MKVAIISESSGGHPFWYFGGPGLCLQKLTQRVQLLNILKGSGSKHHTLDGFETRILVNIGCLDPRPGPKYLT